MSCEVNETSDRPWNNKLPTVFYTIPLYPGKDKVISQEIQFSMSVGTEPQERIRERKYSSISGGGGKGPAKLGLRQVPELPGYEEPGADQCNAFA